MVGSRLPALNSVVAQSVFLVGLKELKVAKWNPPKRVEPNNLKNLRESVEDLGLLYPILVDEGNNIVDGHRRVAVARLLKWQHIPAIRVTSEFQHAYGSLQANQMRLTGNDLLYVFLSNPYALHLKQRRRFEQIDEECGYNALTMLYKAGATASTYSAVKKLALYMESRVEVVQVLRWTLKHGYGSVIRRFIEDGILASTVERAVLADRPLKLKLEAE